MSPGSRVAALPAHLRKRLADAYETGMLPDAPSTVTLRSAAWDTPLDTAT
ncbi:MAG: hypothetical protein OXC00_16710 [Acidimicrobiaceae bacterium]|nr:hypothetical protein [Acidimicrobiaceae bacterium]